VLPNFEETTRFQQLIDAASKPTSSTTPNTQPSQRFKAFCDSLLAWKHSGVGSADKSAHDMLITEGWKAGVALSPTRNKMLGQWSHVGNNASVLKAVAGWLQVCRLVRAGDTRTKKDQLVFESTSDDFVEGLLSLFVDVSLSTRDSGSF